MGVPKFFRWLSERYPAISQLISENRIPEFDALYLDMNGIIHNCTHKDSDSPQFRMTEDKMFIAIFNYIEHLFGKIKPKKLFYMAIDGVAPRAKMNQQRSRRFRTALDAEQARDKAIREGIELPKEDPFDSNCITPGTEFMARLTEQLKYFISKKVTEDIEWQGVEVVLSGHEVPGEGEHKIMEYIRQAKAQPGYNPNVRHCLYGLDADLIMLGLLSHDPHFCLLREEVTFGRQTSKPKELEQQNFYLLHLCIVREYLELEFQELQKEGALPFAYDMERIIDDFILMAFFVGNDFLPNLPNLHINEGALALMFQKYKEILPSLGGYINEQGDINVQRLAMLLGQLSDFEHRFFEAEKADEKWMLNKKGDIGETTVIKAGKIPKSISPAQKSLLEEVEKYLINPSKKLPPHSQPLDLPPTLPARDRKFVQQLATELKLLFSTQEDADGNRFVQLRTPETDEDADEDESMAAIRRELKKFKNAKVEAASAEEVQIEYQKKYDQEFQAWKDRYYRDKFSWDTSNTEELTKLTENYVQGLQWVLYYYYRGVASWGWFFESHYAPMISDVKMGLNAKMTFDLGRPFRPYQQLMGVLPDRSKKIVPLVYHDLMTSPDSPIIDFYPRDFELDQNGKKMAWEAVVKIPFIDEKRLLNAMAPRDQMLTEAERKRNDFGVSLKFTYSDGVDYTYPSSLPGIFPDLPNCRCVHNIFDLPVMEGLHPHAGLVKGVKLGAAALAGFPSLKTLPFTGSLGFHGVNVFAQDSRNESMVVAMSDIDQRIAGEYAKSLLGQQVHVNYPFLQEAKVMKITDELFEYTLSEKQPGQMVQNELTDRDIREFDKKRGTIETWYSKRLGMLTGTVDFLVHVEMLKGLRKMDDGSTVKEFATLPGMEQIYASQMIVKEVISQDERFIERAALPIDEEFPDGTNAFFLGEFAYGRPVNVTGHEAGKAICLVATSGAKQIEFGREFARQAEALSPYEPAYSIARSLGLHPLALSKLTSSLMLTVKDGRDSKVNVGLNLKFEAKKLKVLGYSRRAVNGWEFSGAAKALIAQYMSRFPEFIARLQSRVSSNLQRATDLFDGTEEEALAKVQEIQAWLKEIESKKFEKVPLDAEQLDSTVVRQIELAADQAVAAEPPPQNKTLKGIPRSALLKPSDAQLRLGTQNFQLGDRIIYVADSGKVPIASKGTVVGLTQTAQEMWLDVVFDVSFMSGTSLSDRCSPFRGSTVPTWSVLNLTNRQVSATSRASAARQPQAAKSLANGFASMGINGQAELREVAPPPALTGGWSGAVSSQRGRGRGGMNGAGHQPGNGGQRGGQRGGYRGGYHQIDRGDDQSGVLNRNPNFQARSHHNVPPPTSLDQPSFRGRGRGRGDRSRGTRGRGRGVVNGTSENH